MEYGTGAGAPTAVTEDPASERALAALVKIVVESPVEGKVTGKVLTHTEVVYFGPAAVAGDKIPAATNGVITRWAWGTSRPYAELTFAVRGLDNAISDVVSNAPNTVTTITLTYSPDGKPARIDIDAPLGQASAGIVGGSTLYAYAKAKSCIWCGETQVCGNNPSCS